MGSVAYIYQDDRSPDEIDALRRTTGAELGKVVGERWVSADPHILETYTWQYIAELSTGTNYMERPLAVVLRETTEQVAAIVRICNGIGCQYKALSTGLGAWNAPLRPDHVVQIDLRRMERIVEIDEKNMIAVVEPYVTGNQLQTELFKRGLNTHMVGAGGQTSVLASASSFDAEECSASAAPSTPPWAYTDPEFEKNPPPRYVNQVERVKADRARVVID
jgi:hypothetical protein